MKKVILIALMLLSLVAHAQKEDCNCLKKVAKFSCSPDCDFLNIIDAPANSNNIVTAKGKSAIDVFILFTDGTSYTYEGAKTAIFNADTIRILYEDFNWQVIMVNCQEYTFIKRD